MNMIEVAVIALLLLSIGCIGWYIYGWFRTPLPPAPIPAEQNSALRQERDFLLKQHRIYGENVPLAFNVICVIAFFLALSKIPKDPPRAKEISVERLKQIVLLMVASAAIYSIGCYSINRRVRKAVEAALGDETRPTMPNDERLKRLEEIDKQLKHTTEQPPKPDGRS